MGEQTEYYK